MGSTDDGRGSVAAIVACAAAVLCAVMLWLGLSGLGRLADNQAAERGRIEALLETIVDQQVLVTTWKYKAANGVCVSTSLSTPKNGMTTATWVRTHNEAVAVAQDPDQGGHAPDPECN